MSSNPDKVPWHIANPYDSAQDTTTSRENGQEASREPEATSAGDAMESVVQQVIEDDVRRAMNDAMEDEPGPLPTNSTGNVPRSRYPRGAQIVKSSASFNSPWVSEEKPARLMPDDEIHSSRIFELFKLHAVNFELRDGDTLVFVDYPNPTGRASSIADCYGTAYASRQFRVHSEKLLATGSSVFKDLLGPTRQFRTQRRRKVVNKLPNGVKYVLDLTPPSEGDELVFEMTELSLTPGITKWWMADQLHGVDSCLVNGHDDVCRCMRKKHGTADLDRTPCSTEAEPAEGVNRLTQNIGTKNPPTAVALHCLKEAGKKLDFDIPHYRVIPDYCPIRHCNSIVRLLMLIEGHNVILDSASRVWTLLGISKIFDCPLALRDKVIQWLMYGVNTRFIEVLPEEALRIGFALQLPDITQCAFRILVNELAIELAASHLFKKRRKSGVTVFGRKRGDVGDELDNLIQHAAQDFVDRVESQMEVYDEGYVCENLQVEEWSRLMELDEALAKSDHGSAQSARAKVRNLMDVLNQDFRYSLRLISQGQQKHHDAAYRSIDDDRATYVAPEDFDYLETIFTTLNQTQRRLCAFFYHDLMYLCEGLLSSKGYDFSVVGPGPRAGDLVSSIRVDLAALHQEDPGVIPPSITAVHPVGCERFTAIHLFTYRQQLNKAIQPVAQWWYRHSIDPPPNITRHLLLTLGPNEFKYLPLWAGGNDDGTGGVFEAHVPSTDMGPNGPGPSFHTGMTIPSATPSVSGSLMEEIRNMNVKGSTTAGSVDVHDSISTVYRADQVIADDKSIATESFTSDSGHYAEARYREPADHQGTGKALDMLVDSSAEDVSVIGSTHTRAKDMTSDDWEVDDGSDSGSDTLSDSSMVMV